MSFLPLTLGVGPSDAKGGSHKAPSKSESEKILNRDDHTCRFCGFRSLQFQRVVSTPDGHVTACSFCEQVIMLERAGLMGSGKLIWLPEITQAELNHLARAIYVARDEKKSDMAKAATRALDALMARRTDAKKRLGSSEPLVLATVLHENLTKDEREAAIEKLDGIRLLPLDKHMVRTRHGDVNGFPQMIKFWKSAQGPFAEIPADRWQSLFEQTAA